MNEMMSLWNGLVAWLASGLVESTWWQVLLFTLVTTHITIASVTIFLHRAQAHRALDLHAAPSHFFRFWLWLSTGMVTKEWVAIHRKHHAKCETQDDPHSPVAHGIKTVLLTGSELYRSEAKNQETLAKYGHGTPDDWMERNLYSRFTWQGVGILLIADLMLFGAIGLTVWAVQMLWIPITAAGIINGIGHWWGYRNFEAQDASTNVSPWGIIIGGEELHNNHHAFVTSAKFSTHWYEIDIGWLYIRALEVCGLAKVRRVAPRLHFIPDKAACDLDTLHAVITHRYEVLMNYNRTVERAYAEDAGRKPHVLQSPKPALRLPNWKMSWTQCQRALRHEGRLSARLNTLCSMGDELSALWETRAATREDLLQQLQSWCQRAENSAIVPLERFGRQLRSYSQS